MKNPKLKPLKVLFVSVEAAPFAKVGGLADVAGALPQALKNLGVDISVIMPLHKCAKKILAEKKYNVKKIIHNFSVEYNGGKEKINVYQAMLKLANKGLTPPLPPSRACPERQPNGGELKDSVLVYFIDHKMFTSAEEVYENENKFLFFSKAVVELIATHTPLAPLKCGIYNPDIIHCNDNHIALIPVLIKIKKLPIKTVFTIHNLMYQGKISTEDLKLLNISKESASSLKKDSENGDINKMAQGILLSDIINTVSPTYAKEILTKEYGEGLDNILKMRKKDLYGIINGIDTENLNPENDPLIPYDYSIKNLEGKKRCKEELLRKYWVTPLFKGGECTDLPPLIGLVSRIDSQKGIDLVIEAMPELFKNHPDARFILLGTGLPEYENQLKTLASKYPDNFKALIKFDIKIAQKIYAGSDIFLMPSRFEPCGLGQLTAMRYGTVPIVRKTGGLADTVIKLKSQISNLKTADGFMFDEYSNIAMLEAIDIALNVYQDKKIWKQLVINGMRRDSSWDASAKKYLELYKKMSA